MAYSVAAWAGAHAQGSAQQRTHKLWGRIGIRGPLGARKGLYPGPLSARPSSRIAPLLQAKPKNLTDDAWVEKMNECIIKVGGWWPFLCHSWGLRVSRQACAKSAKMVGELQLGASLALLGPSWVLDPGACPLAKWLYALTVHQLCG